MKDKYTCETCKHEISFVCLPCDPKDKSKGWEPKLTQAEVEKLLWLKQTSKYNPYDLLEFMKEWYDEKNK